MPKRLHKRPHQIQAGSCSSILCHPVFCSSITLKCLEVLFIYGIRKSLSDEFYKDAEITFFLCDQFSDSQCNTSECLIINLQLSCLAKFDKIDLFKWQANVRASNSLPTTFLKLISKPVKCRRNEMEGYKENLQVPCWLHKKSLCNILLGLDTRWTCIQKEISSYPTRRVSPRKQLAEMELD